MRYYKMPAKSNFAARFLDRTAVLQIIVITSIVSVIALILWGFSWSPYPESINYFALKPSNIMGGNYLWTLVTHMFVHGSFLHLFVNMFVLYSLGGLSERIIGRKRFVWFYLGAGLFAGLLSVILSAFFGYGWWENVFGSPEIFMVGASGAIFGIAGLFVVLLPKARFGIIFIPFFTLPAYVMVPLVLLLTWVLTITAQLPVGNVAHLGGFLAGLAYGYYLRSKYKKKVQLLQKAFR